MSRTPLDITVPDLTAHRVVITGASDGIGFGLADRLAAAGAEVIMPVRNPVKGRAAIDRIRLNTPGANVSLRELDLSSLHSVAELGRILNDEGAPIDVLINDAGIMAPQTRHVSQDGLELQFATNYLGHFALTANLLPLLAAGRGRVTTVTSIAARTGTYNWDDLQWKQDYQPMKAYGQSKLATLHFALELQRRSQSGGWGITSNAAHPGLTSTNLQAAGPNMGREKPSRLDRWFKRLSSRGFLVQTVADGLRPTLYAATSPQAKGGAFYGPDGLLHITGGPTEQTLYKTARNDVDASRLWDISEQLTGVTLDRTESRNERYTRTSF
jgi:NAD(P)-dependent dehydrogenase (short-subunit alcohol dehydrogenase family)